LLSDVARRLEASLREGDTVARFGGDEFTLLLHGVGDETEACRSAERILEGLSAPFMVAGNEIVQAASIGVVYPLNLSDDAGELLRKADIALYVAKSKGRGHAEVYEPNLTGLALRRLKLEVALRQAIEAGAIDVHYQPLVELATGRILEVEALARWTDPAFGSVAPTEFIPLAERAGLVIALGEHVLRVACLQLAVWVARTPDLALAVSVNVSPIQLRRPDFVDTVSRILSDTRVEPERLQLEITEGVLIDELAHASSTIEGLRRLGVRIALDDFGTGYSSLSYAKRLHVDTVKIDKVFVDGLGVRPQDTAVVTAALAFARTLGMSTVAEGIETEFQREQLALLGCEIGQGFLFSRPVPAAMLTSLLGASLGNAMADRVA
jgi:predicted signal transduction protein with EAL and GGDEF domain